MIKHLAILVAGAAIGYFIAREMLEKEYSDRADEEILEAENHYQRMTDEMDRHYRLLEEELRKEPTVIVEKLVEPSDLVGDIQGEPAPEEESAPSDLTGFLRGETVVSTESPLVAAQPSGDEVLDNAAKAFKDYQAISLEGRPPKKRKPEPPTTEETMPKSTSLVSVISQLEFEMNEPDNDQTTLVYYAEDGVLTDSVTDKILDIKKAFGVLDLAWFGAQSDDENTCHLRNERLGLDFEVVRDMGAYSKVVLGQGDNA